MIKSFKIVNSFGETLELDIRKPEDTGFLVSSVTGLTYPAADISTSEIALFDGAILGNRRVGARNIVMTLTFYQENRQKMSIEELRHKCYKYFPVKQQITFYVENDSGTYKIQGYIESNEINIFTQMEGAQISIICPDPYFEKQQSNIDTLISKIIPNFSFPCSFEFEGEPVIGYPNEYDGPFVIVPEGYDKAIETNVSYTYGDITITKYLAIHQINASGGETVTIKGDDSREEDIPPVKPEDVDWHQYNGSFEFTPQNIDIVIQTKETYIDNDIIVKAIPFTKTLITQDGRLDHYVVSIGNSNS